MDIKSTLKMPMSNPVGFLVGGAAVYFAAKKFMKIENKYAIIGLAIVGGIAGAMVQSKMKSKATIAPAVKAAV